MPFDDNTLMSFGKHEGKKLKDVPSDYLNWLWEKPGFNRGSGLGLYIKANMGGLKSQNPDRIWT